MSALNHITAEQCANLDKLATYLEALPADYAHFGMNNYHTGSDPLQPAECGTVACAVGHGPAAGVALSEDEIDWDGQPSWDDYSARALISVRTSDKEWLWCFSGEWVYCDNTHHGAAKRIRYLLAGMAMPDLEDRTSYAAAVSLYAGEPA